MLKIYTLLLIISASIFSFAQTSSLSESVEYDPLGNRFLSGNDATSIIQQDTMGNLSYFGQGLPSNFGMEIIGNNLFCIVATSQTAPVQIINVYDLSTETFVTSYTISNAIFLNGMTSDGISKIWLTDFQGASIYEVDFSDLQQPSEQMIVSNTNIPNSPNGITYDQSQNRLVFVSWTDDVIRQVDLSDNSVSIALANSGISNMDGIDMDANNNFYVSSWSPDSRITMYTNDFSSSEILNIPGLSNPADLCVAKEINMLAIPSFQNDVILWRLEPIVTSTNDYELSAEISISLFPNPSNGVFQINFPSELKGEVKLQIVDLSGRTILNVKKSKLNLKPLQVDLSNEAAGTYWINFQFENNKSIYKQIQIKK